MTATRIAHVANRSIAVWRGWRRKWLRATSAALLVSGTAGCLLIYKGSPDQCATNDDCKAFAGTYCNASNVCAPTAGYCTTNVECLTRNPGQPVICRKDLNRCTSLVSPECTGILGTRADLKSDDVVILGFVDPIVDPRYVAIGIAQQNALELARNDFMKTTSGLPPTSPGKSARPIVYVKCDEDPKTLVGAFNHLIDDLKVPAIIGPTFSGDVISIANNISIPKKTLILSVSASSPLVAGLPSKNPRLVWRTVPNDSLSARVISALVPTYLEPQLKDPTTGTVKAGSPMRVAVVHKGDAFGKGLASVLFDQVTFNGMSAADNATASNYLDVNYGDPLDPENKNPDAKYAAAASQVVEYQPHIVLFVGTAEAITKVFVPIEGLWTNADFRPRYVFATGALKTPALLKAIGDNDTLRARVLGTEAGATSRLFTEFKANYTGTYSEGPPPSFFSAAAYDAGYLFSYAVAAVGNKPITGESVAKGLEMLVPPGAPVNVGDTAAITTAFNELAAGHHIDINGATGPLDFDIQSGEAETDIQVWCPRKADFGFTGLYYSATDKKVEGTLKCPPAP